MSLRGGPIESHPSTVPLESSDTPVGRSCAIARQDLVRDCRQHNRTSMTPSSVLTTGRYVADEQESENQK